MTQVTDLPPLKVGQVWQCRNQQYRGLVVSTSHGSGTHAVNMMNAQGAVVQHYGYSAERGRADAYFTGYGGSPIDWDLVRLIYDPDDTQ